VVRAAADRLEIEDLGSTNGTFVNGARISGVTSLAAGDKIEIGKSAFQVELVVAPGIETVVAPGPAETQPALQATTAAPPSPPAPAAEPAPVASTPQHAVSAQPATVGPPAGAFQPAARPRGRAPGTRRVGAEAITFVVIGLTAVALILYFLLR
jgi:uncharacterized membrane protein